MRLARAVGTAAALWIGGLVALLLVRGHLTPTDLPAVASRYSFLAGGALALVAASGVLIAALRVTRRSSRRRRSR